MHFKKDANKNKNRIKAKIYIAYAIALNKSTGVYPIAMSYESKRSLYKNDVDCAVTLSVLINTTM